MTDLSLYGLCVQKAAILLVDGTFKNWQKNPFKEMPPKIVDNIMFKAVHLDGWTAEDFRPLLVSESLRELKIHGYYKKTNIGQEITQIFRILKSSSENFKVLHIYLKANQVQMRSHIAEALEDLLRSSPNMKEIHSEVKFDMKALRNCKNLRTLKLLYHPGKSICDFLAEEDGHLQKHNYLEYFSVSKGGRQFLPINYKNYAVILKHCPSITSLGHVESSGALSLLHEENYSSPINLKKCYWNDKKNEKSSVVQVKNAVEYHPLIEELDLETHYIETISILKKLRNLVFLNITSRIRESISEVFKRAFQETGLKLKHLSFESSVSENISIFLPYCPNLESLRIIGDEPTSASSLIHLPLLQRLALREEYAIQIFPQLSGCNQLTDLFIEYLDDETLSRFLKKKNSLEKLKVAFLSKCSLTQLGIREFIKEASELERIKIRDNDYKNVDFELIAHQSNHKIICNENDFSMSDEFFEKIEWAPYTCCERLF